jgi:hypothetical protein
MEKAHVLLAFPLYASTREVQAVNTTTFLESTLLATPRRSVTVQAAALNVYLGNYSCWTRKELY